MTDREALKTIARGIAQRVKDHEPDEGSLSEANVVELIVDELEVAIDRGLLAAAPREAAPPTLEPVAWRWKVAGIWQVATEKPVLWVRGTVFEPLYREAGAPEPKDDMFEAWAEWGRVRGSNEPIASVSGCAFSAGFMMCALAHIRAAAVQREPDARVQAFKDLLLTLRNRANRKQINDGGATEYFWAMVDAHWDQHFGAALTQEGAPAPEPRSRDTYDEDTCPWSVTGDGSFRCIEDRGHNGLHKVVFGDAEHFPALLTAPTEEWQPIETYPMDGTTVLVAVVGGPVWVSSKRKGYTSRDGMGPMGGYEWHVPKEVMTFPTHWMPKPPLPEPPALNREGPRL